MVALSVIPVTLTSQQYVCFISRRISHASPTGLLHLGHAYAALFAAEQAQRNSGRFLLRIEDIDRSRYRPEFEEAIYEDLTWLGLTWEEPVMRQSERFGTYQQALDDLQRLDLLYPCFCTRKDIHQEIERAGAAPHGPDGPLYPGTCRNLSGSEVNRRLSSGDSYALRLHMDKAIAQAGPLDWTDVETGSMTTNPSQFGDVVLARKDSPSSYHLAVVIDDHAQGITLVTVGKTCALQLMCTDCCRRC